MLYEVITIPSPFGVTTFCKILYLGFIFIFFYKYNSNILNKQILRENYLHLSQYCGFKYFLPWQESISSLVNS